ncbi:MAG: hypothetical protein L6R48_24975, partial [Planctomycetes bacterium]|nr:hypothetical protein [Planctomycetota bacterium]
LHPVALQDFYLGRDPINRANQALAALIFAGRAVARSPARIEMALDDAFVFDAGNALLSLSSHLPWIPALDNELTRVALLGGFGIRYRGRPRPADVPAAAPAQLDLRPGAGGDTAEHAISRMRSVGILPAGNRTDHAAGIYHSDTGEILLETRAQRLVVASARAAGAVVKPGASADAGALTAIASDVPATVAVAALDGRPLTDSRRLLLVYATDAVNTGHETSTDRVVLRKLGTLPVLAETGTMAARLRNAHAAVLRCHALALDGSRRDAVPVTADDGVLSLAIDTARLAGGPALFFELASE